MRIPLPEIPGNGSAPPVSDLAEIIRIEEVKDRVRF